IYQNCNIFNDGAYGYATDKAIRSDNVLYLEHGKPLIFGQERDKAIRVREMKTELVSLADTPPEQLRVPNAQATDLSLGVRLSRMHYPEMPEPLGVFRAVEQDTYDDIVIRQLKQARERFGQGDLQALVAGDDTWKVE